MLIGLNSFLEKFNTLIFSEILNAINPLFLRYVLPETLDTNIFEAICENLSFSQSIILKAASVGRWLYLGDSQLH